MNVIKSKNQVKQEANLQNGFGRMDFQGKKKFPGIFKDK